LVTFISLVKNPGGGGGFLEPFNGGESIFLAKFLFRFVKILRVGQTSSKNILFQSFDFNPPSSFSDLCLNVEKKSAKT
jgi:hypothetical protein